MKAKQQFTGFVAALMLSAVFMGCAMPPSAPQAQAAEVPSHDIYFY